MPQAAGLYYFSNEEQDWSRPAIILLHGEGGNHLDWPPELRRLPQQRIYAPDLPGHGKSEGIGRQSIADYAGCILEFMDELKLRKAMFVGHSMGGAIALQMALHHSRRTLGIAVINAGSSLHISTDLLHNTSNTDTLPLAIKAIGDLAFSSEADPRLKDATMRHMNEIRSSVLHSDFLACDSFDVTSQLGRVKTPTLIVSGSEDRVVPAHLLQTMHQKIKNSLLHSIDGAGHMVMLESPLVVANILQFFLARIQYQPGSAS